MSLSEPFIRRPVMTVVLTVSAILFGVLAYRSLPVNDLPAVDYPVIQVQVGYPGATPETMANNVATPLETVVVVVPPSVAPVGPVTIETVAEPLKP